MNTEIKPIFQKNDFSFYHELEQSVTPLVNRYEKRADELTNVKLILYHTNDNQN